jgi:hypothetical protein
MFDVIVNDVKKYSPTARKLEVKTDERAEQPDVIVILQVRIERPEVERGSSFELQR